MLSEDQVLEILQKVGAFRTGHFVLISGLHSGSYVLKDAMYAHTKETSQVCREMAERFKNDKVEAVIGPAIGAAILAQWVAHHLSEMTGREVNAVYADKDGNGGFIVKRGYDKVIEGKNTLVVEDLTTTGGSIKKVVEASRKAGANVVGAVVICNRGNVTKEDIGITDPAKFVSLVHLSLEQWPENECELCGKNIPVNTDVGHGREFLARKK
ncbi:MAG: phosphoribosyltransferase family protein [bacterium]|nr:phosphoribosyltransferase family protein [bacterium]